MTTTSETPAQSTSSWPWISLSDAQAWTLKWAQTRAKNLNNQTGFYGYKGVYGALDGLANAYSLSKSYFDVVYSSSSQAAAFDAMHNWMLTPAGFATVLLESAILMRFSAMGNVYKEDDTDPRKRQIYANWKIFREVTQASRNALKGIRSTLMTAGLFIAHDMHHLILPSGIALGSAYALSRYWFLDINKQRDDLIEKNTELFKSIRTYGTVHRLTETSLPYGKNRAKYQNSYVLLSAPPEQNPQLFFIDHNAKAEQVVGADTSLLLNALGNQASKHLSIFQLNELLPPTLAVKHHQAFRKHFAPKGIKGGEETIKSQSDWVISQSLWLKTYNGFIDSLYLLLGVVTLAPLFGLTLHLATLCSLMYCVVCIATRRDEEKDRQHQLIITHHQIELALSGKDLEAQLANLNDIALRIAEEQDSIAREELLATQRAQHKVLDELQTHFETSRKTLRQANKLSLGSTLLLGARHGLAAYGALLSAVYAFAILGFLLGISLSPGLVFGCIMAGIPILATCLAHAMFINLESVCFDINQLMSSDTEKLAKEQLIDLKHNTTLRKLIQVIKLSPDDVNKDALRDVKEELMKDDLDVGPQFYLTETLEVVRSFFSGLLKGKKEVEFLLNPLQEQDAQGHFQDSSFMLPFIGLSAVLYSGVFALKAFAKGFNPEKKSSLEPANNVFPMSVPVSPPKSLPASQRINPPVDLLVKPPAAPSIIPSVSSPVEPSFNRSASSLDDLSHHDSLPTPAQTLHTNGMFGSNNTRQRSITPSFLEHRTTQRPSFFRYPSNGQLMQLPYTTQQIIEPPGAMSSYIRVGGLIFDPV